MFQDFGDSPNPGTIPRFRNMPAGFWIFLQDPRILEVSPGSWKYFQNSEYTSRIFGILPRSWEYFQDSGIFLEDPGSSRIFPDSWNIQGFQEFILFREFPTWPGPARWEYNRNRWIQGIPASQIEFSQPLSATHVSLRYLILRDHSPTGSISCSVVNSGILPYQHLLVLGNCASELTSIP